MASLVAENFSSSAACYDTELCLKNRKSNVLVFSDNKKKLQTSYPLPYLLIAPQSTTWMNNE